MQPSSAVSLDQDLAMTMPDVQGAQQVESINEIVASVRQDIKTIKEQFAMLPPAPNSTYPSFLSITIHSILTPLSLQMRNLRRHLPDSRTG
jgi:hypothetical protein